MQASCWYFFMQAAREVFAGHATVQRAGSVSKGTGIQGSSDYDFYVSENGISARPPGQAYACKCI